MRTSPKEIIQRVLVVYIVPAIVLGVMYLGAAMAASAGLGPHPVAWSHYWTATWLFSSAALAISAAIAVD